jgi:hypothetical protein
MLNFRMIIIKNYFFFNLQKKKKDFFFRYNKIIFNFSLILFFISIYSNRILNLEIL